MQIDNNKFLFVCRDCHTELLIPEKEEITVRCPNCKNEVTIYSYNKENKND